MNNNLKTILISIIFGVGLIMSSISAYNDDFDPVRVPTPTVGDDGVIEVVDGPILHIDNSENGFAIFDSINQEPGIVAIPGEMPRVISVIRFKTIIDGFYVYRAILSNGQHIKGNYNETTGIFTPVLRAPRRSASPFPFPAEAS